MMSLLYSIEADLTNFDTYNILEIRKRLAMQKLILALIYKIIRMNPLKYYSVNII